MMEMSFEERPYAGKSFRPTPEIHLDNESKLLIVATPWGARSSAKKVIERMTDYLSIAREDSEATSPFERLSCLSTQANNLRIAALLANEAVYREDNTQEYRSGVELFAAMIDENEVVWIQAGNPHILLLRHGRSPLPVGSNIDLAFDMSDGKELMSPMPSHLLGLDSTINFNLNTFRAKSSDKIVLLSYSHLPELLFGIKDNEVSLEDLSLRLANTQPDQAFWLGLLTVSNSQLSTDDESEAK